MSTQQDNELDTDDFVTAMQDVKPLKRDDKVSLANSPPSLAAKLKREALERESGSQVNYLSIDKVEPLQPDDFLSYKKAGVQEGVFKNLRLGKYKINSVLDLQQCQFLAARQRLFATIIEQHQRGSRILLIRHGQGRHNKPFPAFIKSYVNLWLQQMPEVLAFHSALKCHGGTAAAYVLLKKNREEKQRNREQHRRH